MRVYFEKPRTSVGWKGLIYDLHLDGTLDVETGLHRARAFLLEIGEMGMYSGTEFLDPVVPQYLAGLITWSTIGARTTESQTHRQMASGLSMPVGFKNGTDGNAQIAVDAMVSARSPQSFLSLDHHGLTALIRTTGNSDGHLVLRGGNGGPDFGAEAITQAKTSSTQPAFARSCWWTAATATPIKSTPGKPRHSRMWWNNAWPATPTSSAALWRAT